MEGVRVRTAQLVHFVLHGLGDLKRVRQVSFVPFSPQFLFGTGQGRSQGLRYLLPNYAVTRHRHRTSATFKPTCREVRWKGVVDCTGCIKSRRGKNVRNALRVEGEKDSTESTKSKRVKKCTECTKSRREKNARNALRVEGKRMHGMH